MCVIILWPYRAPCNDHLNGMEFNIHLKLLSHTCWNEHFLNKMSSKDKKNITDISLYIKLDNWFIFHSKICQYRIVMAHLFCNKFKPIIL